MDCLSLGSPQTMHKVFIKYYDKLTNILNTSITNLSRYFVASNLITPEDEDEIFNATRDKARIFLLKIEAPVRGGFTDGFHLMLDIMLQRGSVADIQLAKQLRNEIDEEYKIGKCMHTVYFHIVIYVPADYKLHLVS